MTTPTDGQVLYSEMRFRKESVLEGIIEATIATIHFRGRSLHPLPPAPLPS